jgi:hypothetical protein
LSRSGIFAGDGGGDALCTAGRTEVDAGAVVGRATGGRGEGATGGGGTIDAVSAGGGGGSASAAIAGCGAAGSLGGAEAIGTETDGASSLARPDAHE